MKIIVPDELQDILFINQIVFLNNEYASRTENEEYELDSKISECGFNSVNNYLETLISMLSVNYYDSGDNLTHDDLRYVEILVQTLKGSEVLISLLGMMTSLGLNYSPKPSEPGGNPTDYGWYKDGNILYVTVNDVSSQYATQIYDTIKDALNSLLWFKKLNLEVRNLDSLVFVELSSIEPSSSTELYTSREFEVVNQSELL